MASGTHAKRISGKSKVIALSASVLLVLLALLVFLYRDKLPALHPGEADGSLRETEPFTFETGSRQCFDTAADKLVIASSTGLQILSGKGETIQRQVYSMTHPAIASTSEGICAFYDIGGKTLRLYKNDKSGECLEYDRNYPIISVSVNSAGYLTVTEQETGYKGAVTVLDADGNAIYKWYSGSGYAVDAALSPDCSTLAVLCLESGGSVIHLFKLDSEQEFYSASLPNELAFKLSFFKSGEFCTLSQDSLHFFKANGEERDSHSFEGDYLAGFELSDELCAVVLSKYVSGSDITLVSLASDGDVLGKAALNEEPVSLHGQKQRLLVLCSDGATVYSRDLRTLEEGRVVAGYKSAVLTSKGDVFLLSSHYAEDCSLK